MTASGPRLPTLSLPAMAAFWRRYLSLFATEISAGKRFGEAEDRAGILATPANPRRQRPHYPASRKAAESQRLFRSRQEGDVSQDCVVAVAVPFGPVSAWHFLVTGNFLHF